MESRLVKSASRDPRATYGLGVLAPVIALVVRIPLAAVLGEKVPYITFFLATAVSATYGGFGPGLLTTTIGAVLGLAFVTRPLDAGDLLGLGLFAAISSLISYLGGRLINARRHEVALRILFQQTLISIGDAVISVDEEKCVRLMNPVAETLTGWTDAEGKGRPIEEVFRIVKEDTDQPAEIPIDEILRTGKVVGLANRTELISKTGQRIPIDDSGAPIRTEAGKVIGAVVVFRDITDRRTVERELVASERRARTILESISEAFVLLDHDWRYVQLNPAAEKIMGSPAASLIGKNHCSLRMPRHTM